MSLVEKFFGNVTHEPEGMQHEQPAINNEAEQKAREAEATNADFLNYFKKILTSSDMSEYAKLLGELHITKDPMRPNGRARFMHFGLSETVDDETFKDIEKTLVQIKRDRVASKKRNEAGDKDITLKLYQPDEMPDFSEPTNSDESSLTELSHNQGMTSEQTASSPEEALTEESEPDTVELSENLDKTSGETNKATEQIADDNFELTETIEKLKVNNKELSNKIDKLKDELEAVLNNSREEADAHAEAITKISDLTAELNSKENTIDRLQRELELGKNSDKSLQEIASANEDLRHQLEEARAEVESLGRKLFDAAKVNRNNQKELDVLQNKVKELTNEQADSKERLRNNSGDIQELEAANTTALERQRDTIKQLDSRINKLLDERTELKKQIDKLEDNFAIKARESADNADIISELEAALLEYNEANNSLAEAFTEITKMLKEGVDPNAIIPMLEDIISSNQEVGNS